MSFLRKLAVKGLARGKVASDSAIMSRRNFLKGAAAGGVSKAAAKVEGAVNPVPKIAKTLEKAQDIAATVKAVPTGKQTRRQFLNSAKEVGTRVASKKKLPQKAIGGAVKGAGYATNPTSLGMDLAEKRLGKSRAARLGKAVTGLIGLSHTPMLLSQFTGAVVGAGIITGQHLRGRQLKRRGKKMSRALKEGAASGAITGAGLSAARARMVGLGGKTGGIVTALGAATGAGLGAGQTAIGYKMAKKKKGFR